MIIWGSIPMASGAAKDGSSLADKVATELEKKGRSGGTGASR
jgi:hypothetical protein